MTADDPLYAPDDPEAGVPASQAPPREMGEETSAVTGSTGVTAAAAPPEPRAETSYPSKPRTTLAARVWVAIGVAVVLLVLLIIFIAENSRSVTVSFLGANGSIALGLALLIAALAGVVITLLVGSARIVQLRREVRKRSRSHEPRAHRPHVTRRS